MKKKIMIMGMVGMLALVFVYPANAGLILTFKKASIAEPLQLGQVHYFIKTEATGANLLGRTPGGYGSTFDITNTARAFDPIPSTRFEFWADAGYPNTSKASIRVWNDAAKGDNSLYTDIETFDVPSGSGAEDDYDIVYKYIKATPGIAVISAYEDTGTVYINPPDPAVREVTFMSRAPQVEFGGNYYDVQIKQSIWEITKNSEPAITETVSGKNLTFSTDTADDLTPGTQYSLRVKHKNYWDQESPDWSTPPLVYIVGEGGPSVGGEISATYALTTTADLGVNQFSVPITSGIMFDGTTSIVTIKDLIDAIDAKATTPIVTTVGYWNPSVQVMAGWVWDGVAWVQQNGAPADITTVNIETDKVYQISVSADIGFTLSGTR